MGTPVIRGFKATDQGLIRLLRKAKLQRVLTGEISKELADEIDSYFGGCDECKYNADRTMYGKSFTICSRVGIKQHLILNLIIKVWNGEKEVTREIGFCSGYEKKPI